MKLSEMKARMAAFGLAMLMAVSPLGSAAKVSAAETPKIPAGTDAKAELIVSDVDALDIKKSATDDTFRPEICMEGIRYDASKEEITLVSIKGEDGSDYQPGKAGTYLAEYMVVPKDGGDSYMITRKITLTETERPSQTGDNGGQKQKKDTESEDDGEQPEEETKDNIKQAETPDASEEPEVTITSLDETDTEEDIKQLEEDIEEGNIMILSAAQVFSARSSGAGVNLEKGEQLWYPSYLGYYNTCKFYVNGKLAYCIQAHKASPPSGAYVAQVLDSNKNLQKALYYGYGGAGDISASCLSGKSADERYIYTHIAASYAYAGDDAFTGCSYENLVNAGVISYINYLFGLEEPPKGELSLSKTSVKAVRDGNRQNTPDIKLNGDHRNYVTITVPEHVTIRNHTKGTSQTNGSLKVYGGDTFYLEAELPVTGSYSSGNLHGSVGETWRTLVVSTGAENQDIGVFESESASPVSFQVEWLKLARIELTKKDSDTQNVLPGAVYGIYTDAQCRNLLMEMPATGSNGKSVSDYFDSALKKVYVKEITAPRGYVRNLSVYSVDVEAGKIMEVSVGNDCVKGSIHLNKIDRETTRFLSQGDSVLAGAVYGLYAREDIVHPDGRTGVLHRRGSLIAQETVKKDGTLEFTDLYLGKMFVKEITAPEGYLLDTTQYDVEFAYEGQDQAEVSCSLTVAEQVKKRAFQMIKVSEDGEQTEADLVAGAGFKVYLVSSLSRVKSGKLKPADGNTFTAADFRDYDFSSENVAVTYENGKTVPVPELVTDSRGYAVSPELPYGLYVVKESRVPENLKEVEPFLVKIDEDSREPMQWRVFDDRPFEFLMKIVKKDAQTGNTVLKAGTCYKIYDCKKKAYVEQVIQYPKKEKVSIFTTNEDGYLVTPEELKASTYRIEETEAPEGFVKQGSEEVLYDGRKTRSAGTITGSGEYKEAPSEVIEIAITSNTAHQIDPDTGDAIVEVDQSNDEQVGSLTLTKTGEQLVKVQEGSILEKVKAVFTDLKDTIMGTETTGIFRRFEYEEAGVEGAGFELHAKETIYSPDGAKDENGNRIVRYGKDDLVAELTTDAEGKAVVNNLPLGSYYLKETRAGEHFVLNTEVKEFTLTAKEDTQAVVYEGVAYKNERQRVEVTVRKKDTVSGENLEGVIFGLYAGEDIISNQGKVLVSKDTLLETKATDAKGTVTFDSDLYHGSYYVKEEQRLPGYLPSEEVWEFEVVYTDQDTKVLAFEQEVENQPTESHFTKKDATTGEELPGAKLQILDGDGNVVEEWTSTEEPHVVYGLPEGTYILHEELAPYEDGYVSAADVTFEVLEDGSVAEVEMEDEYSRIDISKTDLTTGEEIPGATLQILDPDGKVLEEWVTDGKPHRVEKLPVGEELTLREISAPDGYIVAEEVKFTLEDTMEVQKAEMKDDYLYGKIMLRKTDGENGKALAGAEFEIRNKTTGMTMETLVTDAGGKAESSDLLIGTYGTEGLRELFEYECVETKAPEGYVLDDTVHPVRFELENQTDNHIVVTLEVKNQPAEEAPAVPKTGDLPWLPMALAAVSIGAVLFFVVVTAKKRRDRQMAGRDVEDAEESDAERMEVSAGSDNEEDCE